MEKLEKQIEKFGKMCSLYWWNDSSQVILSKLEGGQCLAGSAVNGSLPAISLYDVCDCDMFAKEIMNVGAPMVRIVTYRDRNGTLTVPSAARILSDKRADYKKIKRKWNKKYKKAFRGQ